MKILWLSHLLPYPPKGGVLQRSYHLLRQAAQRHELHLVALTQRAQHPTEMQVNEALAELSAVCASIRAFPLVSDRSRWRWAAMAALTAVRRSAYDVNWLWSPDLGRYLSRLAGAEAFDLVHLDTLGLISYARHFEGTPIVLNHHNIESAMMRRRAEREPVRWRSRYFRREARKLERLEQVECARVAMNVTVSELDAARLREVTPRARLHVVDNGVDIHHFAPRGGAEDGLVFAGGMSWYPNREAVLYFIREIWPALRADRPERRATIIGQNPPAELVAATKDPRVSVPGFVPDVRPYIDAASIYICPIRDGGGTRLKILDALAMAKPLVATGLAVEGLGLEEGVHYLRAETPADYVLQIRRLEADPALRQRLASAGRELVERRYAWEVIGEKLERAYDEAVQHQG
jgi:sugar transferase (PEP-CTERM/EpsH1 system associated)